MATTRPRRADKIANRKPPTFPQEDRLTIPNLAITEQQAIKMFYAGTLEDRITGYYEDQFRFQGEEMEHPDFQFMSKIERLKLYNKKQAEMKQYQADIEAGIPREDVTVIE